MTLALAMLLDAWLGEPRWLWDRLPHPAVLMGRAVAWVDQRVNTGPPSRVNGALSLALLVVIAWIVGLVIPALPGGMALEVIAVAILLAQKSLVEHVRGVAKGLRSSLGDGRRAVAMIVGRDTSRMDEPAVARAAIESAAENLSDGVVAPVFWYLIGGLPGMLIYKMVNTADSMIGYRTPRYAAFGWAAARLDDLLNLIPARGTALVIAALYGQLGAWREIVAEARRHRSPNAGWPEAAMARALGVALSGPRSYHGQMQQYPFVHPKGQHGIGPRQINAACAVLWRVWLVLLGLAVFLTLF